MLYIYSTVGRSIADIYDPRQHIYLGAKVYIYIIIYILAVKPAFGGLHCYGAPSTAALQRCSGDCDSMTGP